MREFLPRHPVSAIPGMENLCVPKDVIPSSDTSAGRKVFHQATETQTMILLLGPVIFALRSKEPTSPSPAVVYVLKSELSATCYLDISWPMGNVLKTPSLSRGPGAGPAFG